MTVFTNGCLHLPNCYRTQVWLLAIREPILERQLLVGKEKLALFRRLATGGEGGLSCPRTNSRLLFRGQGLLKGSFRVVLAEGGSRTAQSVLTAILQSVMWWSDWRHLGCFKYS